MNDTFREEYRELTDDEKTMLKELKRDAEAFSISINVNCPDGRHKSLAITKLEESVMWATKGLTG